MEIKKYILLISGFFAILNISKAQQESLEGHWTGRIVKEKKEWVTSFSIYKEGNELKGSFDLPDYGLHHLTFTEINRKDSIVTLSYADKNSKAIFKGSMRGKTISGEWEGLGVKAAFELTKKNDVPVMIREEEVVFTNGGIKLSGTILFPPGKGPFAAIIQVHGSGNQTRSEDFYRSRAYLFAQNGIAVLNFDRRGKGLSTGTDVSMELLADDAIAGVHFLQSHPSIRKNMIGIMGYSQGGYIGPFAASRSKDISFVVAGSAPGITPDEQNDFDVENALRKSNVSEDSIAYVLRFRQNLRAYQYNNAGNKEELESALLDLRTKKWFRNTLLNDAAIAPVSEGIKEWLAFDPLPVWAKVTVPTLLIWGELDNVVPAAKSKELIESVLQKSMNRNYIIRIYKNANHGIAMVNKANEWDWPRLADGYHQMMIDWTKKIAANN